MGFLGNMGRAMTGGIKTGPSQGASFMSKLGGQMPGMVNSLAANYGNPNMSGAVRGAGSLLGARRNQPMPQMPKPISGIPEGQMPGQQAMMQMPQNPGIDTMPSFMMHGSPNGDMGNSVPSTMPTMPPMDLGGIFGRYSNQGGMHPQRRY